MLESPIPQTVSSVSFLRDNGASSKLTGREISSSELSQLPHRDERSRKRPRIHEAPESKNEER